MRKSLRNKIGTGLITIGSLGLFGGYSAIRYELHQKQKGLSERTSAIISATNLLCENGLTFSKEWEQSPDVIYTKREINRIQTAETIGKVGGYGGLVVGSLGLFGVFVYPWKKEDNFEV